MLSAGLGLSLSLCLSLGLGLSLCQLLSVELATRIASRAGRLLQHWRVAVQQLLFSCVAAVIRGR